MVRSNVTEMRIRTLVLAGLFAVGLLANTGIPVLAGNSGATKGSGTWTRLQLRACLPLHKHTMPDRDENNTGTRMEEEDVVRII